MSRNTLETFTIPAGTYWLGDPCYCFDDSWEELGDKTEWFQFDKPGGKVLVEHKGGIVLGLSTAYGDGCYEDQDGNKYPVDAGMIGLVTVGIEDRNPGKGSRKVKFKTPTLAYAIDGGGVLVFGESEHGTGGIVINTEGEDDEWNGEEE